MGPPLAAAPAPGPPGRVTPSSVAKARTSSAVVARMSPLAPLPAKRAAPAKAGAVVEVEPTLLASVASASGRPRTKKAPASETGPPTVEALAALLAIIATPGGARPRAPSVTGRAPGVRVPRPEAAPGVAGVRRPAPITTVVIMGPAINRGVEAPPTPKEARVTPKVIAKPRQVANAGRPPKGDGPSLVGAITLCDARTTGGPLLSGPAVIPSPRPVVPGVAARVAVEEAAVVTKTVTTRRPEVKGVISPVTVPAKAAARRAPIKAPLKPRAGKRVTARGRPGRKARALLRARPRGVRAPPTMGMASAPQERLTADPRRGGHPLILAPLPVGAPVLIRIIPVLKCVPMVAYIRPLKEGPVVGPLRVCANGPKLGRPVMAGPLPAAATGRAR